MLDFLFDNSFVFLFLLEKFSSRLLALQWVPLFSPKSFCTHTKRNSYSLRSQREKSTHHSSISRTGITPQNSKITWARCILINLRSMTPQRISLLLLTYIHYCRLGGMVNFTLPFSTNKVIWITTSQTFRSSVVILYRRRPMAFLSLSLNDTHRLAPHVNVLFRGTGDFPVSYANRDILWNAWNCRWRSLMVDTGILFSSMKFSSREC